MFSVANPLMSPELFIMQALALPVPTSIPRKWSSCDVWVALFLYLTVSGHGNGNSAARNVLHRCYSSLIHPRYRDTFPNCAGSL
jgi:hypothetical protein